MKIGRTTFILVVTLSISLILLTTVLQSKIAYFNYLFDRGEVVFVKGNRMPAIRGKDLNGTTYQLNWEKGGPKTLVLVFSPQCGFCHDNMGNWSAILKSIDRSRFRVVAISSASEGVSQYILDYGMQNVMVLVDLDPLVAGSYQTIITPQTIVLSDDGRIENAWVGKIVGSQRDSIESVLGIKLQK